MPKINQMDWTPYNKDLDHLFDNSGFDMLDKLGFPIWANQRDDEYTSALLEYHATWLQRTPEQKAEDFMTVLRVSARGLIEILNSHTYDIVQ